MMRTQKQSGGAVWLKLRGHRVTALKPVLGQQVFELEKALEEGITAYPDLARTAFYVVALAGGWAYIHIDWARHTVYLVAGFAQQKEKWATDFADYPDRNGICRGLDGLHP